MSTASEHYGQLAGEARTASEDRRRWVLEEIQRDAKRDVERFEGQPFTGKTVAEYMGCQAAAIAALARVVATLLPSEGPVMAYVYRNPATGAEMTLDPRDVTILRPAVPYVNPGDDTVNGSWSS